MELELFKVKRDMTYVHKIIINSYQIVFLWEIEGGYNFVDKTKKKNTKNKRKKLKLFFFKRSIKQMKIKAFLEFIKDKYIK